MGSAFSHRQPVLPIAASLHWGYDRTYGLKPINQPEEGAIEWKAAMGALGKLSQKWNALVRRSPPGYEQRHIRSPRSRTCRINRSIELSLFRRLRLVPN